VTLSGDVTTLAGAGGQAGCRDGATCDARFSHPSGVTSDAAGFVYVADTDNHCIRRISPDGTVITWAGSGMKGFADGCAKSAQFAHPCGIAVSDCFPVFLLLLPLTVELQADAVGNVFVADTGNHRIRVISPAGVVRTFAGSGSVGYCDGLAPTSRFTSPCMVSITEAGMLYVSEHGSNIIRGIIPVAESAPCGHAVTPQPPPTFAADSLSELMAKCGAVTVPTEPRRSTTPLIISPTARLSSSPTAFSSSMERLIDNEALCDVAFEVEGEAGFGCFVVPLVCTVFPRIAIAQAAVCWLAKQYWQHAARISMRCCTVA
jgi:NHL repeat